MKSQLCPNGWVPCKEAVLSPPLLGLPTSDSLQDGPRSVGFPHLPPCALESMKELMLAVALVGICWTGLGGS